MRSMVLTAAGGCAVLLAGCDPVSPEVRCQHEANVAAREQCYRQAGFATGVSLPPLPTGGNRRGAGSRQIRVYEEPALRTPEGAYLRIWSGARPEDVTNGAAQFDGYHDDDFTGVRTVGPRFYWYQTPEPYVNAALDRCLAMP